MKILVTGGKGKIGGYTVAELQQAGHEVVTYDLKDGQDILSVVSLTVFLKAHTPDVVVHLAAHPHPSTALQYRDYLDFNVRGTFNVAEACAKAGVKRVIYSSSTAFYGYEWSVGRPLPIGDEHTIPGFRWAEPRSGYLPCELWYGISKVCCEALLSYYGLAQVYQVVILRFAPVPLHIKLGLKPETAAEAIRLAAEHPGELWYEVFNVASEPGLDITKAREVLGFDPGF
jgi:UDP-glucose 4-epimerase